MFTYTATPRTPVEERTAFGLKSFCHVLRLTGPGRRKNMISFRTIGVGHSAPSHAPSVGATPGVKVSQRLPLSGYPAGRFRLSLPGRAYGIRPHRTGGSCHMLSKPFSAGDRRVWSLLGHCSSVTKGRAFCALSMCHTRLWILRIKWSPTSPPLYNRPPPGNT